MDVATHFLVPYAAALAALGFARRGAPRDASKVTLAVVFGLAGFAPDLDGLVDPLAERVDALYWLQHRGVSHALVGAPFFALALVGTLALGARAWPRRLGRFAWRPAFVPLAVLGSWTHLVLDGVTLSGVPALWPFVDGRWTLNVFSWLVAWMFPIGLAVLGLHAWGRVGPRGALAAGVAFAVLLVALGGWRLAERPDAEGGLVFPRESAGEWLLVEPYRDGWVVSLHDEGDTSDPVGPLRDAVLYPHDVPPGAEEAVARAKATAAWRGFAMGSYGPQTTVAAPVAEGWDVLVTDVAQRYEATHGARWTPTEPFEDWGYVRFTVGPDAVTVTHRGW